MNVIWTLVITFTVALPIGPGEARIYHQMCVSAGGSYVELWGDPDLPASSPQSPHIAKCFRVMPDEVLPEAEPETAPEAQPEIKHNA